MASEVIEVVSADQVEVEATYPPAEVVMTVKSRTGVPLTRLVVAYDVAEDVGVKWESAWTEVDAWVADGRPE